MIKESHSLLLINEQYYNLMRELTNKLQIKKPKLWFENSIYYIFPGILWYK